MLMSDSVQTPTTLIVWFKELEGQQSSALVGDLPQILLDNTQVLTGNLDHYMRIISMNSFANSYEHVTRGSLSDRSNPLKGRCVQRDERLYSAKQYQLELR